MSGNRLGNPTNIFIQFLKVSSNILLMGTKRTLSLLILQPCFGFLLLYWFWSLVLSPRLSSQGCSACIPSSTSLPGRMTPILPRESSTLCKHPGNGTNYPLLQKKKIIQWHFSKSQHPQERRIEFIQCMNYLFFK